MRLLPLLLLGVAAGCQTQSSRSLPGSSEVVLAIASPVRAWEIVQRDRVVGVVVEFAGELPDKRFYSVRNSWHQELGLIDANGRAWRYRIHEREADWLGSGTVVEGAAWVLGLEGGAEVFEVELDTLREPEPPVTPGRRE